MTVLIVLENETELFKTRDLIVEIAPDADLLCFENSLPALAAARSREIDVAVLDTKLTELAGIDFGQYLQDLYPFINLIYLSEDKELGNLPISVCRSAEPSPVITRSASASKSSKWTASSNRSMPERQSAFIYCRKA